MYSFLPYMPYEQGGQCLSLNQCVLRFTQDTGTRAICFRQLRVCDSATDQTQTPHKHRPVRGIGSCKFPTLHATSGKLHVWCAQCASVLQGRFRDTRPRPLKPVGLFFQRHWQFEEQVIISPGAIETRRARKLGFLQSHDFVRNLSGPISRSRNPFAATPSCSTGNTSPGAQELSEPREACALASQSSNTHECIPEVCPTHAIPRWLPFPAAAGDYPCLYAEAAAHGPAEFQHLQPCARKSC